MNIPETFNGQSRIIEILKYLSANTTLMLLEVEKYDPKLFSNNKIKLIFLDNYTEIRHL